MNENEHSVDMQETSTNGDSVQSLGKILSAAREQQGLTQQQVADRLHLRLSSIDAIETDGIEKGVSITFTKGYVRLYARLLGLQADPLLKLFDKLHVQDTQPAKLQSFSKRVAREANDSRWNMVTYVIVLLVIGLVVAWWIDQSSFTFSSNFNDLQNQERETARATEQEQASEAPQALLDSNLSIINAPSEDANASQLNPSSLDLVPENEQPQDEVLADGASESELNDFSGVITQGSDLLESAADEIQDATTDVNDSIGAESESAQEQQDREDSQLNETVTSDNTQSLDLSSDDLPYQVNSDGSVDMVFTFEDDCWVSVKDAFDETIAIGVKVKGRVMEVSGVPPISIILGAPQVVDINFGGQRIDMENFPDGRTANFQLPLQGE